jgi:hypothetical protein
VAGQACLNKVVVEKGFCGVAGQACLNKVVVEKASGVWQDKHV